MQTVEQNWNENGFQTIKGMMNNTCQSSSLCYNIFPASKKLCQASKIISYLPGNW